MLSVHAPLSAATVGALPPGECQAGCLYDYAGVLTLSSGGEGGTARAPRNLFLSYISPDVLFELVCLVEFREDNVI